MEINDIYKSLQRVDILLKHNHIAVSGSSLYKDYQNLLSADKSGRDAHNLKEDIAFLQHKLEMILCKLLTEDEYLRWALTEFNTNCNILKIRIRQNSPSSDLEELYTSLDTGITEDILHIEFDKNTNSKKYSIEKEILDRIRDIINKQNSQLELLTQEMFEKLKNETNVRTKDVFNIEPSILPPFNNSFIPLNINSDWSFSKATENKNRIGMIIKTCWMSFREPFFAIGSFSLIAMYIGFDGFRKTISTFFNSQTGALFVLLPILATYIYYNVLEAITNLGKEEDKEKENISRDFTGSLKTRIQQKEREMQTHYSNSIRIMLEEYDIWKSKIVTDIENLQKVNKVLEKLNSK